MKFAIEIERERRHTVVVLPEEWQITIRMDQHGLPGCDIEGADFGSLEACEILDFIAAFQGSNTRKGDRLCILGMSAVRTE
jgi:hypothetical protein